MRNLFRIPLFLTIPFAIFSQSYPPSGGAGTGAANQSVGWTTAVTTETISFSPPLNSANLPLVMNCYSGTGYTGTPPAGHPTGTLTALSFTVVPTYSGSTLTQVAFTFSSTADGICSANSNGGQGATGPAGPTGAAGTNGTNGTNGNTIWNGSGSPSSGTGVNGDFYLDTTANCLYGPKAAGAWPGTCVTLVGPAGAAGAPSCGTIGACNSVYATTQVAVTQSGAGIQSFTQGGAPSSLPANTVSLWAPSSVPNAFGCTFWGVPAAGLIHATNNTYCVLSVSPVVWGDTDQTTIVEAGVDATAAGRVVGINGVPLCTGFTPTTGQAFEYTTASSPNPCITAATPGGGGTPAFPITVTGGVSGAPACFTSTTLEVAGTLLSANILTKGGGAGVCPSNSSIKDNTVDVVTGEPIYAGNSVMLLTATTITATTLTTTGLVLPSAPINYNMRGHCTLIWEQTTGISTVTFGMGMNNAPTGLWVMSDVWTAAAGTNQLDYTIINSTTTTAVSTTATPGAAATAYKADFDFVIQTGASTVILTIYGDTQSGTDALVIEAGSSCGWLP